MSDYSIEAIGAVPIGSFYWDKFPQNKQSLIDICLAQEKPNVVESNVAYNIKSNLWESKFNFLEDPRLTELKLWMLDTLQFFSKTVNKRDHLFAITESWAHVTRTNGWHGPHRHPTSTWSGIFCIDTDSLDNAHNTFFNHFHLPRLPGYEFWDEQFDVKFLPGKLTIFPSTMLHYAPPYLGNGRRIVLAFNSIVIS